MNRRRIAGVGLGLGLGLLFYLAHRSDRTVSNQMLHWLCGPSLYAQLKQEAKHWLPVPLALHGCLPSALWCFVVTSLVGGWNLKLGSRWIVRLAWGGPLFNAGLEVAQWLHWTDGRGDIVDVVAGMVGGLLAHGLFVRPRVPLEIPCGMNWRSGVVAAGFACVGLADVWR